MEPETIKEKIKSSMSLEVRTKRAEFIKSISGYLIISIILILVLFIVPIVSGGIQAEDFGYYLPKTRAGWIVFWCIRLGTMIGNIAIFILFKQQAKINCKDNANYLEAKRLLDEQTGKKGFIPHSPTEMNRHEYIYKGITLIIFTGAESIVIGTLALGFDFITFLSCITSSVTAVIFGFWTMIKNEIYWTEEYLNYARYIKSKNDLEVKEVEECSALETKNSETCKSK